LEEGKNTWSVETNSNSSYTQKEVRDICENYRGTAFEKAAYKILSNITLGKITSYI
jgi:O6-methylguanine-DNA--protein-cysteine methyltransferase